MDICKKGCNLYRRRHWEGIWWLLWEWEKYFSDRDALISGQPAFSAMLTDEGYELFSDDEYELLWFMATVIYTSTTQANGQIKTCEAEVMSELEEKQLAQKWRKPKEEIFMTGSMYFSRLPQEDLVCICGRQFESDEDIEVSPAGRELIFVACKTLIDALETSTQVWFPKYNKFKNCAIKCRPNALHKCWVKTVKSYFLFVTLQLNFSLKSWDWHCRMKNNYFELINQTYFFHRMVLISEMTTWLFTIFPQIPHWQIRHSFRLTYLPRIGDQIKKAKTSLTRPKKPIIIRANTIIVIVPNVATF